MSSPATLTAMCLCKYGTGDNINVVEVPKEVLQLFRLFRDVNEDCPSDDGSFYADIPIIKDARNVPIEFNKEELEMFFQLAAINSLEIDICKKHDISPELLKKFLILINFLDNDVFLHALCHYAAYLIKKGKFILN